MADDDTVAALLRELEGYERYGNAARAAQVRDAIKAAGGKPPAAPAETATRRRPSRKD